MLVAVKQPAQPQACSFSASVWGAEVGAEEEARVARGGGGAQGEAVFFAFGDGQAVVMRPDAAGEDVVAVDDQVMRGDGGGEVIAAGTGIGHAFLGRDMFHHHAQAGDAGAERVPARGR